MTDITHTPAWQKAVDAAEDEFFGDGVAHGDEESPIVAALKAALPHILAALTESAEPLLEGGIPRVLCRQHGTGQCAPICLSHMSTTTTSGKCPEAPRIWHRQTVAIYEAVVAPLQARIQALEDEHNGGATLNAAIAPLKSRIQALEAERGQQANAYLRLCNSVAHQGAEISDLEVALKEAERQRDAAIEALEESQWGCDGLCPACGETTDDGHAPDCPIGRALSASEPAPRTEDWDLECCGCGAKAKSPAPFHHRADCPVAPRDSSAPGEAGYSMDSAPKDHPILAYCDHEADPFEQGKTADGRTILTLYAAHAEGMGFAPTGFHIIEWGGAFDDSTWEYPDQANLPDWWFVAGSEWETAANPVRWWPLPAPQPAASTEGGVE